MMKKYLMTGIAAVALSGLFTACNNVDDLSGNTAEFNIMKNYEEAFITRFGQPAANQTWGFGNPVSSTRGVNANGNMWASEEGGGWVVPPQLTAEQKDIVRQYFQQNQDPAFNPPTWENYFIQQVYKGGTNTSGSLSPEKYTSANNDEVVGSDHMDHLAACNADGSIKDHIYNYNFGTCSIYPNILNTEGVAYYEPNDGTYHSDAIQLMVGSTTAKFGYFNSDGSLGHTEYTGLVSWETISKWAGIYGTDNDILNDGWNRSFMGFDFEQIVGYDIYVHTDVDVLGADGNPVQVKVKNGQEVKTVNQKENKYAKLSDFNGLSNTPYVWYNGKLMKIGTAPAGSTTGEVDILDNFTYTWNGGESFSKDDNNNIVTFNCKEWGGLATNQMRDWSQYEKLVVEFAETTTVGTQIIFLREDGKRYTSYADPGVDKIEFNIAGTDLSSATQLALQTAAEGQVKISRIYLTYLEYFDSNVLFPGLNVPILINETNQYCGVNWKVNSDDELFRYYDYYDQNVSIHNDGKAFNLDKLKEKYDNDYLPVDTKGLKEWVKVQGGADGYYSDWIVTLTEAKTTSGGGGGGGGGGNTPTGFICRVIAEDLTVDESTDFDFNDVVFDVFANGVIRVRACGGTLPLRVDGQEVHGLFGEETGTMINTGWNGAISNDIYEDIEYSGGTIADAAAANNILVEVYKQGRWWPLTAPVGDVASKIAVGEDYPWCSERQDIDTRWHLKDGTKTFSDYVRGNIPSNEWYRMVIEEAAKYQNK